MNETTDAKGREVYTVHPQILAGSAEYRHVPQSAPATQTVDLRGSGTADLRGSGKGPADEATDAERGS